MPDRGPYPLDIYDDGKDVIALELEFIIDGRTVMQAMQGTHSGGEHVWHDQDMTCSINAYDDQLEITLQNTAPEKGGEQMTDPRINLPQEDPYGMDFTDDVLTAEEREELAAESDEENAKR